jgi:hypothetical protein
MRFCFSDVVRIEHCLLFDLSLKYSWYLSLTSAIGLRSDACGNIGLTAKKLNTNVLSMRPMFQGVANYAVGLPGLDPQLPKASVSDPCCQHRSQIAKTR